MSDADTIDGFDLALAQQQMESNNQEQTMSLEAMCIGCGCTDFKACYDAEEGAPCHWKRVDRAVRLGVCSTCKELVKDWDAGDRTLRVPSEPPR